MPLSHADVGRRVSVRRILGEEAGRRVLGDVVGLLVSWEDGSLTLRHRDGHLVVVAEDTVVAGKVVPGPPGATSGRPARERRRSVRHRPRAAAGVRTADELERVAAAGWRAPETERLGGWLLRAAGGFTGRANSALAVGDPGVGLDPALEHVLDWYAARELLPRVAVVTGTTLDTELGSRSWMVPSHGLHAAPVLVQTAEVGDVLARSAAEPSGRADDPAVRLDPVPDEDWLGLFRGGTELPPVARAVLAGHPRIAFASVGDSPRLAIGRAVVDDGPDGRWVGLYAVEVAPTARRQGLARAVVGALLEWGKEAGAARAYLQVSSANSDAVALYASLGFSTHHSYVYRVPGSPGWDEALAVGFGLGRQ